jgi:molecular chaperone HscB
MPTCWSCQNEAGDALFCERCGKIQPSRPRDAFQLLGIAPRFHLDEATLEKSYRDLSRKVHPDKFAKAEARERRFSIEQSTQLNQAFKSLRDPTARAEYLLKTNGFPVPTEEAGKPGAGQRLPLEFYEEVMEDREALLEAKTDGQNAVDALAAKIVAKRDTTLGVIERAMTAWEVTGDRNALAPAATELAKLRYYARFLDEVEGRPHEMF